MLQRFSHLLYREWQKYTAQFLFSIVGLLLFLSCFPFVLKRWNIHFDLYDYSMLVFIIIVILSIVVSIQFANNIRNESKNIDIWLHSTASFRELIVVKMVYYLLNIFIIFMILAVYMLILIRLTNDVSVIPFIPLFFFIGFFLMVMVFTSLIILIVFMTILIFLKRYFNYFAYLLTILLFIFYCWASLAITDSTIYTQNLMSGFNLLEVISLPKASAPTLKMEFQEFFYMREFFFTTSIYLLIGHFSVSWLERVLKR